MKGDGIEWNTFDVYLIPYRVNTYVNIEIVIQTRSRPRCPL